MTETERGHALLYSGKLAEAAAAFRRVLARNPNDARAHSGLGNALLASGDDAGAAASLDAACRLSNGIAGAFSARAWLAHKHGNMALAGTCAERAIALDASDANGHFIRFHVLWHGNRFDEAERSFERAAAIHTRYVDERHELGDRAFDRKEFAMAVRHYRAYTRQRPHDANGWMNLGSSLMHSGDPAGARSCLERAVTLAPTQSRPLAKLAAMMKDRGETRELIPVLQRLLELSPAAIDVRLDLALSLISVSRYSEAKPHLAKILELDPRHMVARWLDFQRPDDVVAHDQAERDRYLARWREGIAWFEQLDAKDARFAAQADATLASSTNFYLAYLGQPLVEEQRRNAAVARRLTLAVWPGVRETQPRAIGTQRRRVLIFSPSLLQHSVERVWANTWLGLDPAEFELCVMHAGAANADASTRWRERGIRFETGPRQAATWIADIQSFAPDIVVYLDIGMHQLMQALPSLRLAPTQVTTWAHPVTSGMDTIDYFLSADAFEPDNGAQHYTERLVRLPRLGTMVPLPEWRVPEFTLETDAPLRLLCTQHAHKLHPGHDALFARVLAQLPDAELDILCSSPPHVAQALAARMQESFAQHGVDFGTRCRVHPLLTHRDYLRHVASADICLDSLDFSGCITSIDALWCERPIVTLPGTLMRGRQTAGLMRLIGLDELIATSEDDYVRIAVRLAQDAAWRAELRARIHARKTELFEDRGAVEALAQFLRSVEHPADRHD
ncbi:MAG TPA: tetratricopeptide repeat protein [Rudaea sp.]|nr:tetratricopeptide repeat protein [Rudaea sp.]